MDFQSIFQVPCSYSRSEIERECLDAFDKPECEAVDISVNEVLCVGKACSNSYVNRAPHAFTCLFNWKNTLSFSSILSTPFCDTSTEAELLYSLITKAKYENNRYQKPKKQQKTSSQHVDWF